MSGGGKGGSTTSQVQIPAWLESAARQNLARADRVAQLGYTPYYGPDVAAMTPMQIAAMQNTNNAASAFGMAAPTDAMAGMPQAQTFAGGVQGYSSAPIYQQSVDALAAARPGQYNAMQSMFVDPMTGAQPMAPFGSGVTYGNAAAMPVAIPAAMQREYGGRDNYGAPIAGGGTRSLDSIGSYAPGGVNTRDPGSLGNRVAAAVSGPQGKPTAADRPVSRSSAAGGGAGMGGKK